MIYRWHYLSAVGDLTMTGTDTALTSLYFTAQKHIPVSLDDEIIDKETDVFVKVKSYLNSYFKGERPEFSGKIEFHTTPFRKQVYEILSSIPYGKSLTYGEIAKRLIENNKLKAMSAQAVGNAVGHNPVCIIIPCHRVLGKDGALTGFAGGLEAKKKLLSLEGIKYKEQLEHVLISFAFKECSDILSNALQVSN